MSKREYYCAGLNRLCKDIAAWRERKGFSTSWNNVPEKLMLVVTELSEAMEAYRHISTTALMALLGQSRFYTCAGADMDRLLNFREELADTCIRLFDLAGSLDINLEGEIEAKMHINEGRPQRHGKQR